VTFTAVAYRRRAHRYGLRALLAIHLARRAETCTQQFIETAYLYARAACRMAALALETPRARWSTATRICTLSARVVIIGRSRYACCRILALSDEQSVLVDVYNRVAEELRPGVYAQWADPRERWRR
jgi:hypothetical protein